MMEPLSAAAGNAEVKSKHLVLLAAAWLGETRDVCCGGRLLLRHSPVDTLLPLNHTTGVFVSSVITPPPPPPPLLSSH